ncbi:MAG: GNAT family N-acetyltransferase [Fibrobacterales bacterium]
MIRKANTSDLSRIADLRFDMFKDIGTTDLLIENFKSETIEYYNAQYESNACTHHVYEIEGEIIACAGAIIKSDFPSQFFKQKHYGYIMDVYVTDSYRKQGIATKLIESLYPWFRDMKISSIKLDSSANGIALYQKLNFSNSIEMTLLLDSK